MIDRLLATLAPHHCYGCQKSGPTMCGYCKNDITDEPYLGCLACGRLAGESGVCRSCRVAYERAWCVSERRGSVEALINAYKFDYVKAAAKDLADMLDSRLPELPSNSVLVPIPTIHRHIRQRGYDHTDLVCRRLGRMRKLPVKNLLIRNHSLVQRGATRAVRVKQAKQAFSCNVKLSTNVPYILVDDVVTTGATIQAAAKALRTAGAEIVWAAAIARQPIDQ